MKVRVKERTLNDGEGEIYVGKAGCGGGKKKRVNFSCLDKRGRGRDGQRSHRKSRCGRDGRCGGSWRQSVDEVPLDQPLILKLIHSWQKSEPYGLAKYSLSPAVYW